MSLGQFPKGRANPAGILLIAVEETLQLQPMVAHIRNVQQRILRQLLLRSKK